VIAIRRAQDRGRAEHGWLTSFHTFSFADYYDPAHLGFGALRVINEDRVQPGKGFGTHGHRDMEILSYVLDGELAHQDNMGNGSTIRPGDVQRMSAGTGVMHSEKNPSSKGPVHFLQIWIQPNAKNLAPSYEQRAFGDERRGKLRLVASPTGESDSLTIHQDARVYASLLARGESVNVDLAHGRRGWLQVARGEVILNGASMRSGDGAAITGETKLAIDAARDAEFLLFDLGL
jgi:redox-sensitive bicupin YhaK (pirin superfamily)